MTPSATMSIAPPGWTSSAGWKSSRTPAGQRRRGGESEARPEQHGGVGVVPAGVHHAVDGGGERQAGVLLERQRVQVGAQRDTTVAEADVADEAGAAGEGAGLEPGRHEPPRHELGGAVLGAAELGYGVQGTSPGDDVSAMGFEPGLQPCRAAARAEVSHGQLRRSARGRCVPPARSPHTTARGGPPATGRSAHRQ